MERKIEGNFKRHALREPEFNINALANVFMIAAPDQRRRPYEDVEKSMAFDSGLVSLGIIDNKENKSPRWPTLG